MKPDATAKGEHSPGRFVTTRWSVILSCTDSGPGEDKAREALAELCRTYWRPIFAFICRRGYSVPDAQDLTQDFFLMVLEGNLLKRADPSRGRFRSLLLKALQNFLIDNAAKKHARKRGGNVQFVSWDDWMAEAPSQLSISAREAESWPAEKIFDVRWAATVVEHALRQLGEECESPRAAARLRCAERLSGGGTGRCLLRESFQNTRCSGSFCETARAPIATALPRTSSRRSGGNGRETGRCR